MTDNDAQKTYKQLVDFGLDAHGFYGLIYSPDNGANYKLLVGTQGRIFYPEDARNFWPYLKSFVSEQLTSTISIDWNDIKNKPDIATKSDIPSLQGLAKLTDIPKSMGWSQITGKPNLVLKSNIPSLPSNLVKSDDLTKVEQKANEAISLASQAESVIDKSATQTNKKPSEYSEGFSYELKRVNALNLDRSNYSTPVQQGTIGLLYTEAVSSYARQTLKVLDSPRPLTFERNGQGGLWNDWEFVNPLAGE